MSAASRTSPSGGRRDRVHRCSICGALPDRVETAAKAVPELFSRLRVVTREPTEWRTFFECTVCGTVWEENYEATGHGERPLLDRVHEP